jgi:DNA-binding beta-propeller fold protein YncE
VKTGPPVMEFDAADNYIQGWGGQSGDGYTWPTSEHGITVDYKGFVWISGNGNDDQILKFTKDGKFLMQIGHAAQKKTNADTTSLWKPADVYVYPKTNEIFVADGYGNKRIIVFDADTGAYKRMWGAFGNVPMEMMPRVPLH